MPEGSSNNNSSAQLGLTSFTNMPDIINATTTTSVLATNGTEGASTIDIAGDQDWWSVSLTANTNYTFRLNSNGIRDPYLRLLDSAGTQIAFDDDSGGSLNSLINYRPTSSGTYYLSAQAFGTNTGDYLISATAGSVVVPPADILGTLGTSSVLATDSTPGASTIGSAGDQDWWRVALTQNTTYTFRLTGNGLSDPYLRLLDSTGTLITANDDGAGALNSLITYTAPSTNTYYLSAQAFGNLTGDYFISATAGATVAPAADILGTIGTTSTLTVNGAAGASTIGTAGDQDWWAVSLTQNTAYQFRLNNVGLPDPYLRLLDSTGTLITANDDGGGSLNSLINYTPTTTGTYFLSAQGFGTATGAYELTATSGAVTVPPADILGTIATASSLATNGTAGNSRIDSVGDQDWWRVSLTANTAYEFRLNGSGITGMTDPYLRLLDSGGTLITFNDDGGGNRNALINYTPTTTGTYYLSAEGYGNQTGTYEILATAGAVVVPPADILGTTATTSTLTLGAAPTESTIGIANDQDWFKVALTSGSTYRFRLDSDGIRDPFLRLMNAAGAEIAYDDDSGGSLNSLITFTATSTGNYFLSAQGYGGATGDYLISAALVI